MKAIIIGFLAALASTGAAHAQKLSNTEINTLMKGATAELQGSGPAVSYEFAADGTAKVRHRTSIGKREEWQYDEGTWWTKPHGIFCMKWRTFLNAQQICHSMVKDGDTVQLQGANGPVGRPWKLSRK